jgi:hypothetical protein
MTKVKKLPKSSDGPRRAFVEAWQVWVRDTAQQMVEAHGDFEGVTAILHELAVCREVMTVLVEAGKEDMARGEDKL